MHTVLAARSSFSIGESILTVEELIEKSKAIGASVVALTDTMSITGMIDFTNRAKKADIKPILGCRLRLSADVTWRKTKDDKKAPPEHFVTYYVLSETGLKALFKLLTLANSEERFYNTAKLSYKDLYDALDHLTADDVIITSGDVNALTASPIADVALGEIAKRIGKRNVYMVVQPINTPYYDTLNLRAIKLADQLELELLVTRPVLYGEGEADAADVMNAVSRNVKMADLWIQSPAFRDLHPLGTGEWGAAIKAMYARLKARGCTLSSATLGQGLSNTLRLAMRASYVWSKAPVSLPKMSDDEFATLVAAARKGWSERLTKPAFGHQPTRDELIAVYKPRLEYELSVLKKLGFAGYFLLVMDIVNYAKSNGILVGPGRGSVGGSLVAYLVGITDCDPIRFDLLFERFINPDRIDLPDADLDFMSARRGEIIDYLIGKYGKERVAGISNFGKLAAASAIRNIGKAFGLNEFDYACSKFAPKEHGANVKLPKAAEIAPEIGAFRDKYSPIWDVMVRLEGVTNILGRHAAGVVVGGCDLVERGVIERRKDGATMNWDKRIVEDQGLVKVDILGLETLDLIDLSTKYIRERSGTKVDLMRIPLDDARVLDAFANGKTTGIFQFESGGMRRLLKELGKDVITFDDITAATALYRPGPMESGMMDSYWKRKQGQESVDYDHPALEEPLKPTYGVFVYQEQVMRASVVMAGYSGADADKLRKIMGKKLPEEMAKERGKFVNGCVATQGITPDEAGELFDKIEGFAGYGFNKSHSVEYTLISYQAMWLKVNYPVEFYAAALSLMKEDKLAAILKDANNFGVRVVMPDMNNSSERFEILNETCLAIPFNRIKGISEKASLAIMKAREAGPFKDKADFVSRVERRTCNKRVVDALDAVGAFSRIEPGQLPAHDPSRILAQRELIPGLVVDTVPIDREMHNDKFTKAKLGQIVGEYRAALGGDGQGVKPIMGKAARFMVIMDAPSSGEERMGAFTFGDNFRWINEAMSEHGLERADAYWTGLIKRPKEGKQVSPAEIELYGPYLDKEIDLLKPPLIVLLGSITVRNFFPDFKGKASDAAGKIIYSKRYDANFVIGFNPGEIYHDPDKQIALNEVFGAVVGILD